MTYLRPLTRAEVATRLNLAVPGAEPWREGSGEGIALASGFRAAEVVLSSERAAAEAPA